MLPFLESLAAQPLSSMKYLDGYFYGDPGASETTVKGDALKKFALKEYRGLTLQYSKEAESLLETAVKSDAQIADDKEVSYRKGKLYYAFLTLPRKGRNNRYLFYLNQTLAKGNQLILIYMEGEASAQKIKKMIKK